MKELKQKLEALFSAFDADEAFDLETHKAAIMGALAPFEERFNRFEKAIEESSDATEENVLLRRIITNDCKAKLVLLGEEDADRQAEELEVLDVEQLTERREEIIRRFDSRFSIDTGRGSTGQSDTELSARQSRDTKDIQAYQL